MDARISSHNTPSLRSKVRVFYRFHPLHGEELEVTRAPRSGQGAVTAVDPSGRRLNIPSWMLFPAAGDLGLSLVATVHPMALVFLADLLQVLLSQAASDSLSATIPRRERRRSRATASARDRSGKAIKRSIGSADGEGTQGVGKTDGGRLGGASQDSGRKG